MTGSPKIAIGLTCSFKDMPYLNKVLFFKLSANDFLVF